MTSEGPARRREIEDTTAARLAEIVAVAERAAKQVIDEAEAEAHARVASAEAEADRVVAARLAALGALTAEIDAQAVTLRAQAEALHQALAEAQAEFGEPSFRKPSSPALTVVADAPAPAAPSAVGTPAPDPKLVGAAAGARLLATQMAVSGSSRAEIEGRLRDGFELADTEAILDAILGPEQ